MKELMATDETEFAKKVVAKLKGLEAGWFRLTRLYGDYEKYDVPKASL